jgi:hypothetical protein
MLSHLHLPECLHSNSGPSKNGNYSEIAHPFQYSLGETRVL